VSYDLSIRPRPGSKTSPVTSADAASAIGRAGAKDVPGTEMTYRLPDSLAGGATVDIESTSAGAERIDVSMPYSDSVPADVYLFCARVARSLEWQVFDPQGDAWYSASQLEAAAEKTPDPPSTVGGRTLLSGAVLLFLVMIWLITGRGASAIWAGILLTGACVTIVARVMDYLELRGRGRRASRPTRG